MITLLKTAPLLVFSGSFTIKWEWVKKGEHPV
jgi:hypothetical protein